MHERAIRGSPHAAPGVQAVRTDSGLEYLDVEIGSGTPARTSDKVQVHYRGWLTDGTMFERTDLRHGPLEFRVGEGEVIPAFDEGIKGMLPGGAPPAHRAVGSGLRTPRGSPGACPRLPR